MTVAEVKAVEAVKSGCPHWQPETLPEGENEATLEEKRVRLLEDRSTDIDADFVPTFWRLFLNNQKVKVRPEDVFTTWPTLFQPAYQLVHFQILTDVDAACMIQRFKNDVDAILVQGKKEGLDEVSPESNDEQEYNACIKIIFNHFDERVENILKSYVDFSEEILNPGYPYLIIIGQSEKGYSLIIDGCIISISKDLLEAVELLLTSYLFIIDHTLKWQLAHSNFAE
ncbi:hypothetical protein QAD02_013307 [Eretmocerus hayati]|uniref:Uncharacterized protein n=1 Tax=Eretmocerus hayati TaxID=131215 RepID=A0ACC2P6V0_9HYME|nr:hypothetical protein QAD02_013307 [Eretmocerus hayati]